MKNLQPEFNGLGYLELRPLFKNKPGHRFSMPKGLPELPRPIPIQVVNDEPDTEKETELVNVRRLRSPLTGKGFCAVVIDSGVFGHEFLRGNIRQRLSTNGNETDINDHYGHGTHMAGIIAASNSEISSIGIAPGAGIISIKVTNEKSGSASWKAIYKALVHTLAMVKKESNNELKIGVVNISFNGLDAKTDDSDIGNHKIAQIINELSEHDIPVVVSAGNAFGYKNKDGLGYPAFHPSVIAAGAHGNFRLNNLPYHSIAPYSQRYLSSDLFKPLSGMKKVNSSLIYAPGLFSVSLNNSNDATKQFSVTSGTSVSAAVISGTILLMQEKWNSIHSGRMPLTEIRSKLKAGCEIFQNVSSAIVPTRTYDFRHYTKINIFKTLNLI